jgi:translocation and assembly module TamB
MKAARRSRKKLLVGMGGLVAFVVLLVVTLPLWFPWVLRPILQNLGIRFESYQAVGYTKFALVKVEGAWDDVRFESARVEAFLPTRWLWSLYFSDRSFSPNARGGSWRLTVKSTSDAQPDRIPKAPGSTFKVLGEVESVLGVLRDWVPAAHFTNGVVDLNSEEFRLPEVDWKRGSLAASVRSLRFPETIALRASVPGNASPSVSLSAPQARVTVDARFKKNMGRWEVEGETRWLSNRMVLAATFLGEGWWPQSAQLTASSFHIPATLLKLEDYEDLTGSFAVDWAGQRFTLDAAATAEPKPDSIHKWPPIALKVAARGDEEIAVVEKLSLTAPGIKTDLTGGIAINRSGKLLTDAASMQVFLDLAELPGSSMTGKLQGFVRLRPGATEDCQADFELSGANLHSEGLDVSEATLAGQLSWPTLEVRRGELKLEDSSNFAGNVRMDLESRIVDDGRWSFQGRLPRIWQPGGVSYTRLQTTGEFRGPITRLIHSGQLSIQALSIAPFSPCAVQATWQGEEFDLSQAQIQADAGNSSLRASGALRMANPTRQASTLTLSNLTLEKSGQIRYGLERPCEVSVGQIAGTNREVPLKAGPFRWIGSERGIHLQGSLAWPHRGSVQIHCQNLTFGDFADFLAPTTQQWSVTDLNASADWNHGPMTFETSARVNFAPRDGTSFSMQGSLRGGPAGAEADRVIVSSKSGEVVSIHGTMPITIVPGSTNGWLNLNEEKPIDLRAVTTPNKIFWDGLTGLIGFQLSDPLVDLSLRGTLSRPEGVAYLKAERLEWKVSTNTIAPPTMERVQVAASFEQGRVQLKTFSVELEGQPVRASGELPLGKHFWTELVRKGELPDWQQSRGRLEIVDARLDLFARYLPKVLSPQGRLSLEVEIQPGARLAGQLEITNAATRPFDPLGHIHDIHAQVKLADRGARIETFSGQIGGQVVNLAGRVTLSGSNRVEFDVSLQGTNVPLVREPGILMRTDLNVRVRQEEGRSGTISGELMLRDSLFLQDLKTLVQGGPDHLRRRPPYFAVTEAPFDKWKLDLRIKGDRFLRVRTPLFRGEISAAFQLSGEMAEPVALGEVRVASGRIQFPFGTLKVDQGYVGVTSEDPYRPRLFVMASGRTYGHEIKMEVSGLANEPRVTFNSTPPLTSEQILMLLTAGELPHEDISLSYQQRAARLAMFVGKDFLGRLIGEEGTAERLTIRSGEEISEENKQTYYIEYRLSDRWSAVGEYDRFNALNAGLKWKIFSK